MSLVSVPCWTLSLILFVSISSLFVSAYESHPKCTRIPASDAYHGTCFFQYVIGKGYVKTNCPSGTRYVHAACTCVTASAGRSMPSHSRIDDDDDDKDDDAHHSFGGKKLTSLRELFGRSPLSIIKYFFTGRGDNERNDDNGEDERENDDGHGHGHQHGPTNFDGYRFYGGDMDAHERDDYNDDGHHSNGGAVSREDGGSGRGHGDTSASTHVSYGHGGDDRDMDDNDSDKSFSQTRASSFFDKVSFSGSSDDNEAGGHGSDDNELHGRDNDIDDKDESDDDDKETSHHPSKHGYGSIYSVKGMLSRQKQHHYEDLYADLFDDDDVHHHHHDDDDDDKGHSHGLQENYEDIYEKKLDGVLEYVDDILDDVFDGDFDAFYEDVFDGDGYDDCFVKKYAHYFDEDYQQEIDDKYDDFDEFFKNYVKVKMLTSGLSQSHGDDNDDNDDNDNVSDDKGDHDHGSNAGRFQYGTGERDDLALGDDKNDDDDNDNDGHSMWSGKGSFESYENRPIVNSKASVPKGSLLFDFTRTLKQNVNTNQNQDQNVFDSFNQGPHKH